MFTLIFSIIFGIALALFAIQNTNEVTITIASVTFSNIPLWVIVIASTLIGLVFASYFNIINTLTAKFQLRNKDKVIKGADKRIEELKNENQDIKAENSTLKAKKEIV